MLAIVITPKDNSASRRSAAWGRELAQRFAPALAVHVTTSRTEVDHLVSDHRHVFYFGHGERDALVAHRRPFRSRRVLMDAASGPSPGGRIVIAVACWSGDGLARTLTDPLRPDPVACYLGWLDEVSWPVGWHEPIGEALVDGLAVLGAGASVGDCVNALRSAFDGAHARYRQEGGQQVPADRAAFGKMCALYWKERIAVEGDVSAVLDDGSP